MKKGCLFLAMMLAMLVDMVLLPSLARSEFYVGAYLGASFSPSVDPTWEFYRNLKPDTFSKHEESPRSVWATRDAHGISVDPAFIAGGKFGYWFTMKSLFGLQMPSWLKYFGFELDISYRNLRWPSQEVNIEPTNFRQVIEMKSTTVTSAFLFLARYGFLPDAEVPLGRLQPYIGFGPLIFVSNTKVNIGNDFHKTEADVGLALETGLRYMIHPKVSLYSAFRYRYIPSHVSVDDRIFDLAPTTWSYIEMHTDYHLFDLMVGAAYHF